MKRYSLLSLALAAGLSTQALAAHVDATVTYDQDKNSYSLNWESNADVTIHAVAAANPDRETQIAHDNTEHSMSWIAPTHDRYRFLITDADGDVTEVRTRVLPLEGGRNFRELGGYKTQDGHTVKWGKLYRSGALHNLTKQDYEKLSHLNIQTIVDFRTTDERATEVTNWQAGDMHHLTWDYKMEYDKGAFASMFSQQEPTAESMEAVMAGMYPGLVNQQKDHYIAMFDALAETGEPLLFHCTAGKDRTGIAAALILTALGVDRDTIINDYTLTERVLKPSDLMPPSGKANVKADPMMQRLAKLPKPALAALAGARVSYIDAAFREMESQSGSVMNYIRDVLQVSDADLVALKAQYLDASE